MKKILLFFLLFTFYFQLLHCKGQNLVPNPSFEDTTSFPNCYFSCPYDQGQICLSSHWNSFSRSPEYFNSCSINSDFSTPSNWCGYQIPANGNSYAGFFTYTTGFNNREFIGTKLVSPLIIGQKYFVQFKVCMIENSSANCANDRIGALFTTVSYNIDTICDPCTNPCLSSQLSIPNFSQVFTNQIITDTVNWTTIVGSFVADSAYRYVTFGNFFDDFNTNTQKLDTGNVNCVGYYFIDDIYVGTDSTNSTEQKNTFTASIHPNPATDYIEIEWKESNILSADIVIYSSLGSIVHSVNHVSKSEQVPIHFLEPGLYFISVKINGKNLKRKLIVNR